MRSNRGKLIGLKRSPYGEESYDSDLEKYYMVELEGKPPVKYVDMTAEKIVEVLEKHVLGGEIVKEYALAAGNERVL